MTAWMKADLKGWKDFCADPKAAAKLTWDLYHTQTQAVLKNEEASATVSVPLINGGDAAMHGLLWVDSKAFTEVYELYKTAGIITGNVDIPDVYTQKFLIAAGDKIARRTEANRLMTTAPPGRRCRQSRPRRDGRWLLDGAVGSHDGEGRPVSGRPSWSCADGDHRNALAPVLGPRADRQTGRHAARPSPPVRQRPRPRPGRRQCGRGHPRRPPRGVDRRACAPPALQPGGTGRRGLRPDGRLRA